MCGINGIALSDGSRSAPGRARAGAHARRDYASRPGRGGPLPGRQRRPRPPPPEHRGRGRRAPADDERGRLAPHHLQRRDLQPRGLPRRSWKRAATSTARTATPKRSSTCTRSTGAACVEHLRGMFAFAIWDAQPARALHRARPARRQAALLRAHRRRLALLRLRDQVAAGGARRRARTQLRGAARLSGEPRADGRGDALPRRQAAAAGPHAYAGATGAVRDREVLGHALLEGGGRRRRGRPHDEDLHRGVGGAVPRPPSACG